MQGKSEMRTIVLGKDTLPAFRNPVVAIGSFDGLHLGHRAILNTLFEAAQELQGDSILISFDPHPRFILDPGDQGFSLICSMEEKVKLLEKTNLTYLLIIPFDYSFSLMMPQEFVEHILIDKIKPLKIIAGYDHRFGRDGRGDNDLLRQYASKGFFQFEEATAYTLKKEIISSSRIRELLYQGKIRKANQFLGYPFFLTGEVISGKKIGRKIGYRTANLKLQYPNKILPKNGIYSSICTVNGNACEAMLYIGHSESVAANLDRQIEVHILDFNQDIYGQIIKVELLDFIRDDKKFSNLDDLSRQIAQDERSIRQSILKYKLRTQVEKNPKIAIAILNYNGQSLLETYLPGVVKHAPKNCELVLIDNGSSDGSLHFVQHHFPEVRIIRLLKNYGFASGYNKAIAQLDADYVAILNSDIRMDSDWITPIIDFMMSDPFVMACQPKILSDTNSDYFEYAGAAGGYIDGLAYPFCRGRIIDFIEQDYGQYNDAQEIFWASGAAMVVKTIAFKALGGFDEDYFAHQEEIDLCWRMRRMGGKIYAFGNAHVYHLGGGTLDYDNPRKTYLNFRNNLFTLFKNAPWIHVAYIVPVRFVLDFMIGTSYLLKGKGKVFYKILQAYIIFIINLLYLIYKKANQDTLIESLRIDKSRQAGVLKSSIFYQFYVSTNRIFSSIPSSYFKK